MLGIWKLVGGDAPPIVHLAIAGYTLMLGGLSLITGLYAESLGKRWKIDVPPIGKLGVLANIVSIVAVAAHFIEFKEIWDHMGDHE